MTQRRGVALWLLVLGFALFSVDAFAQLEALQDEKEKMEADFTALLDCFNGLNAPLDAFDEAVAGHDMQEVESALAALQEANQLCKEQAQDVIEESQAVTQTLGLIKLQPANSAPQSAFPLTISGIELQLLQGQVQGLMSALSGYNSLFLAFYGSLDACTASIYILIGLLSQYGGYLTPLQFNILYGLISEISYRCGHSMTMNVSQTLQSGTTSGPCVTDCTPADFYPVSPFGLLDRLQELLNGTVLGPTLELPSISSLAGEALRVSKAYAAPNPVSTAKEHRVTFVAEGKGISQVQVEVYDLAGNRVHESDFQAGNALSWNLLSDVGRPVANGVYLYVVTAKGYDGQVARGQVHKLVVLK